MRAAALLIVFILAKTMAIWRIPVDGGCWVPLALIWQDVAFALCFALLDRWLRRPVIGWSLYVLAAAYATINVPITRAISSPLTWPMLRAVDLTLSDSI